MGEVMQRNRAIGLLGARLIIGCLSWQIAMHKLFINGLASEMQWFQALHAWFPMWVLSATNIYCALVEFVGGLMLVFGIKRDWALWGILSVLVIVNFGHGLEHEVWDIQQLVFRVGFLLLLLLLPADWDVIRLESLGKARALFGKQAKAD